MASKTDRILGYLPSTFRAQPRPTALYSVVDAFGGELLDAENSLAAVMQAHWVDVADLGAEVLDDLIKFAALYGLAPRDDESVEEFRQHLKRYVRTFLDGTVTVRGILRVTAETLGLHIDDDHLLAVGAAELHTVEPRGDDAADIVLGVAEASATGTPARPARLAGTVDLHGGIVLPADAKLRLAVDGGQPVDVTLTGSAATSRSLDDLVRAVNEALGAPVAAAVAGRLVLSSPTVGAAGRLAVPDVGGDAADAVLGLASRAYTGTAAQPARVIGTAHLGPAVDLHDERYLRIQVDGVHLAEVDCAGQEPASTSPAEVRDAVNAALGVGVAALDGDLLTLTSPTAGFASRIDLLAPAAQDATARLLGTADRLRLGQDAEPARATGRRDLSAGVDLRQAATIALRIDGGGPVAVDCARFAIDPAAARLPEIVLAINTALGQQLASHDGRLLTVASAAAGPVGTVTLDTPATGDATAAVFGVGPREFAGADATTAQVVGRVNLGGGVDLRARHLLRVAVDDRPPVAVDLRAAATAANAVTPAELARAIDRVIGTGTGGSDGRHLTITSPTAGPASRVVVEPLEVSRSRRFVTRAIVVDDAAQVLLGYSAATATGTPAAAARLVGTVDLSRGTDLREGSHLRLAVDGAPPVEVDCAGDRPRAVPLPTVVAAVNAALAPAGLAPAGDDGRHLVLTSPSEGGASRITVADSHELDAADRLLGVAPGSARGSDTTTVRFTSTVDLGGGVDLEPGAAVSIGIDGAAPAEIVLGGPGPTHRTLDELVAAINAVLGSPIAGRDATRLSLTSPTSGPGSRLEFAQPAGPDATRRVLGIPAGRSYHGAAETQAQLTGVRDLSGPVDLSRARFLRIGVDQQPPRPVDCAAGADNAAAVRLGDIVTAINTGLGLTVASAEGARLRLASPRPGAASQLTLEVHISDAARKQLLGTAPQEATGTAAAPAELTGAVALQGPVDLSERSVLRLAVDGRRPVEVDLAGAAPASTFLDEVVAAVNAELPGVASGTDDDRLRLRSLATSVGSRVEVLPLRTLEVVEYPAQPRDEPPRQLRHGDAWTVDNDGAAEAYSDIRVTAPRGAVGPGAVNGALGWQIRVLTVLAAGEMLRVWRRPDGVPAAQVTPPGGGAPRAVPPAAILAGPLGGFMLLPAAGPRHLAVDALGDRSLHLDDPAAPDVVRLRALRSAAAPREVTVSASAAGPGAGGPAGPAGAFDVLVRGTSPDSAPVEELYTGVRVGAGAGPDSLVARVNGGATPSRLVRAEEYAKATALRLPLGRSGWRYLECRSSRFDEAAFPARSAGDGARFSGGRCTEVGVFGVSRFADSADGADDRTAAAVFGSTGPRQEPPAEVRVRWSRHEPGSFEVNLPADLAPRFGGRFGSARFASTAGMPERYRDAVTEPSTDPRYLVKLIAARPNALLHAETVITVPIGFQPVPMPIRRPRRLTQGGNGTAARLYLAEPGIVGFIQLTAREPGAWGNDITVTARRAGPGTFDVTVAYAAARFENARQVVLGRSAGPSAAQLAEPGSVGVLQAKAAGVRTAATRDRTQPPPFGPGGA